MVKRRRIGAKWVVDRWWMGGGGSGIIGGRLQMLQNSTNQSIMTKRSLVHPEVPPSYDTSPWKSHSGP